MIQLIAWTVGIVAALLATLLSVADSALLAFHASEAAAPSSGEFIDRERQHRALSMGRVVSYLAAGAAFAQALHIGAMALAPRMLTAVLVTVVICTIAEGVGRAIGYVDSHRMHRRLSGVTQTVATILRPAVALGATIDRALQAVIPQPNQEETRESSTEQFREVVAAEADVSRAEEELIHGVFSLGETEVHEVMVPRVDIVGIDDSTPWSEVLDRVRSSEHARFPVYHETLDEVVAILYAKDLLASIIAAAEPEPGWLSLARAPAFIPISKRIDAQLREFQASRTHIAIVSDEYGGTAGLVTIEDILEEIVGEIRDEYDVEEPEIEQEGMVRYWVSGRVPLDELVERLNARFDVEDVSTVGGLVYALFGRVPKSGDAIVHGGFRVVVERVRRRRIERVYFERLAPVGVSGGEHK
jgi:CBS domain containing-hemolysin-like protein